MFICGYDSKCLRIRKRSIALLVLALMAVIVAGSSCTHTDGNTATTPAQTTGPKSLDIRVQNVNPELGLQVLLIPKDENGLLFKVEGNVNAKLWLQKENGIEATNDVFMIEWNIYVTKEDYTEFLGVSIFLKWGEFYMIGLDPAVVYYEKYCILEVTLTMPDGTMLSAEKTDINVLVEYRCC